jgi:hypothetical protein
MLTRSALTLRMFQVYGLFVSRQLVDAVIRTAGLAITQSRHQPVTNDSRTGAESLPRCSRQIIGSFRKSIRLAL